MDDGTIASRGQNGRTVVKNNEHIELRYIAALAGSTVKEFLVLYILLRPHLEVFRLPPQHPVCVR